MTGECQVALGDIQWGQTKTPRTETECLKQSQCHRQIQLLSSTINLGRDWVLSKMEGVRGKRGLRLSKYAGSVVTSQC